ncbi:Uncharacterized protein Adt_31590 [Abeliophyllum distichum]|uniref:Uncharacterized protein n=1 Tax=Abeliophyllum distichum TaxID=126358 RepID=A0ABD1RI71_9LAMI
MDKDISRASADSQAELLVCLSEDLVAALKHTTLELSASARLTLRWIHQEVSILLYENVELRAKKARFVQTVAENESLNIDINSAKSKLNELSAEVMIEDSLLISLESKMKELQPKIDDCKMRLAAKKCNTSLEIEHTKAMMARYSELVADDPYTVMEILSTVDTCQRSEWSKLRDQMWYVLEELNQ